MLHPEEAGLFDRQLARLAHTQLRLLEQGGMKMTQLATKAVGIQHPLETGAGRKSLLKMANASLRVLLAKKYVRVSKNLFELTKAGQAALVEHPVEFSPEFVGEKLLAASHSEEAPIQSGWGGWLRVDARRRK